jgi:DNA invertase Pin-like site-specific DNA recombinase
MLWNNSDLNFFIKNEEKIYDKLKSYKEIQSKIDRNKVKEMYLSGKKQIEIVKYFKSSKSTISEIIKELNIKGR